MHTEQQDQFNARLSQWISNQGFWFQLRHSLGSTGSGGNITFHLLRLTFRLLIFVVLLSLGGLYYLVKRTDGNAFRDELRESISQAMGANQLAMRGAKRVQGNLEISRLASEGGPDTFFEFIEIRNLRCQMGMLDGLVGQWEPGNIAIHRIELQLRAGTDTPELSTNIGEVVFRDYENINIRNIDIANANIGWGYSERTRGRIDNTSIQIRRVGRDWRITLRGGEFSQNWMRGLEIIEIVAICTPEGIEFEKADLRQGSGTVDFKGLKVSAGDRPELSGMVKARGIVLDQILPAAARNFVEGRISSDFNVSGSTNTVDGVSFDGMVNLDGFNTVTVRDRIHVLRALSVVDLYNNYRRLDFTQGSFRLTTRGGQMWIRDMNLVADELATLSGEFTARPPTAQELDAMMARGASASGTTATLGYDEESDEQFLLNVDELERQFTLRQAANAARRAEEAAGTDEDGRLFDRIGMNYEARMFSEQQAARLSRMLIYEGEVLMTLLPNASERTEALLQSMPVDPETGRIHLKVPLAGPLHELTLLQAEALYEMGRR